MDDHQIERARGMHAMSEAEYEQHVREQIEQARAMQSAQVFSIDAPNLAAYQEPPKRKPRLSWWNRLFG